MKIRAIIDLSGAYCDRSFKTTIQLTNHVNTHLGVKPFQVKNFLSEKKRQIFHQENISF